MCVLQLRENGLENYRLAKKWEWFKIVLLYRVSQKKVDSNKYLLIFCRTCDIFESLHVSSRHHGTQEKQDSDHL